MNFLKVTPLKWSRSEIGAGPVRSKKKPPPPRITVFPFAFGAQAKLTRGAKFQGMSWK